MFRFINKTFGCCNKSFGCSNKNLLVVPNFVAVTKPFFNGPGLSNNLSEKSTEMFEVEYANGVRSRNHGTRVNVFAVAGLASFALPSSGRCTRASLRGSFRGCFRGSLRGSHRDFNNKRAGDVHVLF